MKSKRLLLCLSLVVFSLLGVGCSPKTPATNTTSTQPSAPETSTAKDSSTQQAAHYTVNIENFAFSPIALNVNIGDTVTWVNLDSAPHTVTGGPIDSKTLQKEQSYSYTFTQSGSIRYTCSVHPAMHGDIIVK